MDVKEILKQMFSNELKVSEMGFLLRNYATPEELQQIEEIVNRCKSRQMDGGKNITTTLLSEFFKIAESKKGNTELHDPNHG